MDQIARKQTLVLMAGLAGTGKTTLASALGTELHWPVLSKDTLKTSLLMIEIVERVAGFAAYELLFALAHDILVKQRVSVIIDSPAFYPFIWHRSTALARQAHAEIKVLHCITDPRVRSQRLSLRRTSGSLPPPVAILPEEEQQLFSHLPLDRLILSTTEPLEHSLQRAIAYIQNDLW